MFATAISTCGNGTEQRFAQAGVHARRAFSINTEALESSTLSTLLTFWADRRGSSDSFRFRDPFDYTATAQPLHAVSGGRQLVKSYTVGAHTYYRPITKPVSGSVTLTGGGSVDYATGIVSGGSGGTWSGSFDISARFMDDKLTRRAIGPSDADAVTLNVLETVDTDYPVISNTTPDETLTYTLSLAVEVGRATGSRFNTRIYTTGLMEERTVYWSADREFFDPCVILCADSTDLHTLISLFLVARGRLAAFTFDSKTMRFASDALRLSRTGYDTYEATMSLIEVI